MSDLVSFVFIAQTTMLVITSLLLAYPVVAYARNVAYTRGLLLLAGAFFVVTTTYVTTFWLDMPVVSGVLDLLGALLAAAGAWQFARPFVRFDGGSVETTATDGVTGGFESAGND